MHWLVQESVSALCTARAGVEKQRERMPGTKLGWMEEDPSCDVWKLTLLAGKHILETQTR